MDTQNTASSAPPSSLIEDFRAAADKSSSEWATPRLSVQFEAIFLRGTQDEKQQIVALMTDAIQNDAAKLKDDVSSVALSRFDRISRWSETLTRVLFEESADVGGKPALARLSDCFLKTAAENAGWRRVGYDDSYILQVAQGLLSLGKKVRIPDVPNSLR